MVRSAKTTVDNVEEWAEDEKDDEILVEEETSKASEETNEIKEEPIKNIEDNEESIKNIDYTTKENDVDVLLSKKDEENVCQVIEIVESNPRITLWSARSAAVLRYLRKTEDKLINDKIKDEKNANDAHYIIGKNIREVIKKNGGTMPEDLPTPEKNVNRLTFS